MKKQIIFIALILGIGVFFGSTVQAQWNHDLGVTWTMDDVGIGIENPEERLHLFDTGPVDFRMSSTAPGESPAAIGRFRMYHDLSGDFLQIALLQRDGNREMVQSVFRASDNRWLAYNYLNFTNGKYEMRAGIGDVEFLNTGDVLFNGDGGVGIDVDEIPEGFKFAVNGKVIAEELQVQLKGDWPDFVFADDYELMSLYEVENYIKQNRHLPNVPSEAQVLENGVNVGEMTSILLQKVEELTLHIIELNKRIEELEK